MRIRDYVTGRVLAWAAIAILASIFGMGRAHAAVSSCPSSGSCNVEQAHAAATTLLNATATTTYCKSNWGSNYEIGDKLVSVSTGNPASPTGSGTWDSKFKCKIVGTSTQTNFQSAGLSYWFGGCPANAPWNSTTKTCFNPEQCLALNSQPGFNPNEERAFRHAAGAASNKYCPASACEFVRTGQVGGTTCAGGECITYGSWNYSGNACSTTAGDPGFAPPVPTDLTDPTKPKQCVPAGDGLTFCRRDDGRQCHTSSTGKENCWLPGETGVKTTDDVLQKRDAGPTDIPPNLNLPNGDTLIKQTPPPVTTTTTPANPVYQPITTTTTNYRTQNGTNAASNGGPGTGTPTTAPPGGGEGEGDDDEGGNEASGGATCDAPPTTSGDPLLSMVAQQQWLTRCGKHKGDDNGDGLHDSLTEGVDGMTQDGGEGSDPSDTDVWQETDDTDGSSLDQGGWTGGGGTCPALALGGGGQISGAFATYLASPPPFWCSAISWFRAMFIMLATVGAVFILGGFRGS